MGYAQASKAHWKGLVLISILVALVVIGVILYLLNLIPMDGTIRTIIHVIVVLFVILWLLQMLGVNTGVHLPR